MNDNVRCISTRGRFGSEIANAAINKALWPHGLQPEAIFGAFWHQSIDSAFCRALEDGIEWILTIDGDTMPTADQVGVLLAEIKYVENIDCLAAAQVRRDGEQLLAAWDFEHVTPEGRLQPANQAHFGLTFLRTECLKTVETPWFLCKPDSDGHYRKDDRLDADMWFWQQWRAAGHRIWIDRECTIGHLDESVLIARNGSIVREGVREWHMSQ